MLSHHLTSLTTQKTCSVCTIPSTKGASVSLSYPFLPLCLPINICFKTGGFGFFFHLTTKSKASSPTFLSSCPDGQSTPSWSISSSRDTDCTENKQRGRSHVSCQRCPSTNPSETERERKRGRWWEVNRKRDLNQCGADRDCDCVLMWLRVFSWMYDSTFNRF